MSVKDRKKGILSASAADATDDTVVSLDFSLGGNNVMGTGTAGEIVHLSASNNRIHKP